MILTSYNKAIKVIESCTNEFHILGAQNYINNFFTTYSVEKKRTYFINQQSASFYEELRRQLDLRKIKIRTGSSAG